MQLRAEVQTGRQGRGSGEQEGFAALVIFKVNRRRYRMLVVQRWRVQFAFTDECRGGAVTYGDDVSDALHAREVVQGRREPILDARRIERQIAGGVGSRIHSRTAFEQ